MQLNYYLVIALMVSVIFGGYEHFAYKQYRTEVQAEAEKQKVITENTNKWNDQVIKETQDAYQKRMAAIDTKYGRLHYSSSSSMPNTATKQDTSRIATKPTDSLSLERDCTVTTNMLVSLQDIIKESK